MNEKSPQKPIPKNSLERALARLSSRNASWADEDINGLCLNIPYLVQAFRKRLLPEYSIHNVRGSVVGVALWSSVATFFGIDLEIALTVPVAISATASSAAYLKDSKNKKVAS